MSNTHSHTLRKRSRKRSDRWERWFGVERKRKTEMPTTTTVAFVRRGKANKTEDESQHINFVRHSTDRCYVCLKVNPADENITRNKFSKLSINVFRSILCDMHRIL